MKTKKDNTKTGAESKPKINQKEGFDLDLKGTLDTTPPKKPKRKRDISKEDFEMKDNMV